MDVIIDTIVKISIHALHEESDQECLRDFQSVVISIHALHEESDSRMTSRLKPQDGFQSTLSMRRATELRRNAFRRGEISIHALHEESDLPLRARRQPGDHFNPRSP